MAAAAYETGGLKDRRVEGVAELNDNGDFVDAVRKAVKAVLGDDSTKTVEQQKDRDSSY